MTDEALIAQKIAEVAATADLYPGVVIVHHVPTQTVRYMSRMGLELLDTTQEALTALGPDYQLAYFNPLESDAYTARAFELIRTGEGSSVHTLFQEVNTVERAGYSLYLTSLRRLLAAPDGSPLLLMALAVPIHPDNHFATKVARLLEENAFLRSHAAAFGSLTSRERDVLRLVALGYSSAEVAGQLFISVQTADTHRRNLRQKLGTASPYELGQYARAFDLI